MCTDETIYKMNVDLEMLPYKSFLFMYNHIMLINFSNYIDQCIDCSTKSTFLKEFSLVEEFFENPDLVLIVTKLEIEFPQLKDIS